MRQLLFAFIFLFSISIISCSDSGTGTDPNNGNGDENEEITTYSVAVDVTPSDAGSISPSSDDSYEEGEDIELQADANEEYLFTHWSGDIDSTSDNPLSLTVDQDYNLTANFELKSYELVINKEGEGTVSEEVLEQKSKDYDHGTVVKLTANPDEGYKFVEWQGDVTGSENPAQITVDNPKEVTAIFERKSYSLSIEVSGEGSVNVTPDQEEYKYGTKVDLTAEPNNNWKFEKWGGDTTETNNPIELTIKQKTEIVAHFKAVKDYPKTYGGSESENASSVAKTKDGGFIITGSTRSTDGDFNNVDVSYHEIYVMKFDSEGNKKWVKTFGGKSAEGGTSIIQTSDGGYALTGRTQSDDGDFYGMNNGGLDLFIIKLTPNGTKEWVKTFGNSSSDRGRSITETSDGNLVVTGYVEPTYSDNYRDIILIKLNKDGEVLFEKTFGGSQGDTGEAIVATENDGVIITGSTYSNDGTFDGMNNSGNDAYSDIFLIKVDSEGNIIWKKTYGGSNSDEGLSLAKTNDNGFAISGWTTSTNNRFNSTQSAAIIIKVDSQGTIQWENIIGGSSDDYGYSIIQLPDNELVITGQTDSNDYDFKDMNKGESDIFLLKLDSNGNESWLKTFGGTESDNGRSVILSNENLYFTGGSSSNDGDFTEMNSGYNDIFIYKTNINGTVY